MTRLAITAANLRALVRAMLLLAVGFGLQWSGEQVALIMLAIEALLSLFRFTREAIDAKADSDAIQDA